jgi:hypothetical protein
LKRRPAFFVEDVASGVALVQLYSWEESFAWHDRRVISCGWQAVSDETSARRPPSGAAGEALEPKDVHVSFRLLPSSGA